MRMPRGGSSWKSAIHRENLALYKKRIEEPHTDREHQVLLKLLAAEEAKEPAPKKEE